MDPVVIVAIVVTALFGTLFLREQRGTKREMARLRGEEADLITGFTGQINAAAKRLGEAKKNNTVGYHARKGQQSKTEKKLHEAGLETSEARGKFLFIRIVSMIVGPLLGVSGYLFMIPYYATLFTLFMSSMGLILPILWLNGRVKKRTEDIQRELPLVLDLTNLATSAGWDVSSALERVIDALYAEFPTHPLLKELKRARLSISSGFTWEESLIKVANKLDDDTVRRTALALAQAIRQGGDRSNQLEGIARDAQRVYYSSLDKRLAALPVKTLFVTLLLMISYFLILMAPAVVQLKDTLLQ